MSGVHDMLLGFSVVRRVLGKYLGLSHCEWSHGQVPGGDPTVNGILSKYLEVPYCESGHGQVPGGDPTEWRLGQVPGVILLRKGSGILKLS